MVELLKSSWITKKDAYNAQSIGGSSIQDEPGIEINCCGVYQYQTTREDEKEVVATVLFDANGERHVTLSETICANVHALVDVFGMPEKDNVITVKVVTGRSKNNRTFYQLEIV